MQSNSRHHREWFPFPPSAGFKKLDPFLDTGLDFAEAYEQALTLNQSKT